MFYVSIKALVQEGEDEREKLLNELQYSKKQIQELNAKSSSSNHNKYS